MNNIKNFIPCSLCNNGYIYEGEGVKKCICLINWQNESNLTLNYQKSMLFNKNIDYQISSYIGKDENENIDKLKKFINYFDKMYTHLYLWSRINSTQKTTIAQWIGKELIKKDKSVYFIIMDELVKDLTKVEFKEESEDKINFLSKVDFLIIDDCFDPSKVTLYKSNYQLSFVDNFLRKRLEVYNKATCFTSNIDINKIGETWGQSLQALIERNVKVLEFKDRVDKKEVMSQCNYNIF